MSDESATHHQPLGRRSVVRGAAWAVPAFAVASAAPAYAVSVCSGVLYYTLDWATAGSGTVSSAQATTAGAGNPVGVTVSSNFVGAATAWTGDRTVVSPVGGLGQAGLYLNTGTVGGQGNRQDLTLTFSRPVTNLHFSITDIDQPAFAGDRVSASVVPTSQSKPGGVLGTGTTGDPWRYGSAVGANSNQGNVELTFSASLSSITISVWSIGLGTPDVSIASLDFNANCM